MISGHAMVDFLFTHTVFQLSCCPYKMENRNRDTWGSPHWYALLQLTCLIMTFLSFFLQLAGCFKRCFRGLKTAWSHSWVDHSTIIHHFVFYKTFLLTPVFQFLLKLQTQRACRICPINLHFVFQSPLQYLHMALQEQLKWKTFIHPFFLLLLSSVKHYSVLSSPKKLHSMKD